MTSNAGKDNAVLGTRLIWLDVIRGVSLLWVFLVHFVERLIPGSFFANPTVDWPSLNDRVAQLAPLPINGFPGVVANAIRYVGWLGDQGVQVFLVASGFALTWNALRKKRPIEPLTFWKRRVAVLLPEWWLIHAFLLISFVLIGSGLPPSKLTVLSFFGFRFLPEVMYYFAPAWWFIGLIIQLYLIFPFLMGVFERKRPARTLLLIIIGSVFVRTSGLLLFSDLLDWWSRGAVFLSRLPEFLMGMLAAWTFTKYPKLFNRWTTGPVTFAFWFLVWAVGNLASFTLLGMGVAFLLTGIGAFVMFSMVARVIPSTAMRPLATFGQRSYSFYLVHHSVLIYLVSSSLALWSILQLTLALVGTLVVSLVLAEFLRRFTAWATASFLFCVRTYGLWNAFVRTGTLLGVMGFMLLGIEAIVRATVPQEVDGWGELPSLSPDPNVGYRLRPNSETRLRWQGYNYVVSSNELGFPGLLKAPDNPETLRIFVTGDAFESAEGVDTDRAWPRKLESELFHRGYDTCVFNFSITGWGPQHFSRVVKKYAPRFEPDLFLVGFFVNEFFDVRMSDQDYSRSIGFDHPPNMRIRSFFELRHLRSLLVRSKNWVKSRLSGNVLPEGYFFANLAAFEVSNWDFINESASLISTEFATIAKVAEELEATVVLVLVPASVQVCDDDALGYVNWPLDRKNEERWDWEQPQTVARELAEEFGFVVLDLRKPLQKLDRCPYQKWNMHWTEAGHRAVAEIVASELENLEFGIQ